MRTTKFFALGEAVSQGSKQAFVIQPKGGGKPRAVMTETSGKKLKVWRDGIQLQARQAFPDGPYSGDVMVSLVFHIRRPKSHYGTGRNAETLKASAKKRHNQKPDIDKLTRAVLDALTGPAIVDDSQVFDLQVLKKWSGRDEPRGCWIRVREVGVEA